MTPTRTNLSLALGLGTALTAATALPALAGSYDPAPEPAPMIQPAPAPVTNVDWTGPYAGLQLGYADVNGTNGAPDGDGETVGAHLGYRWDMGSTVYGVELDYDDAGIDLGGAAELDDVTRLKGQVGYEFGNALVYGTAGAARANTTIGDETGWLAGVGVAYAVTPSWSVGGEVLYHDFDEFGTSGVGAEATTATIRASFRF